MPRIFWALLMEQPGTLLSSWTEHSPKNDSSNAFCSAVNSFSSVSLMHIDWMAPSSSAGRNKSNVSFAMDSNSQCTRHVTKLSFFPFKSLSTPTGISNILLHSGHSCSSYFLHRKNLILATAPLAVRGWSLRAKTLCVCLLRYWREMGGGGGGCKKGRGGWTFKNVFEALLPHLWKKNGHFLTQKE